VRSDMALSAQEPNSGRNFGNTMELAVFGRVEGRNRALARARSRTRLVVRDLGRDRGR
jgi:hypothetical protein